MELYCAACKTNFVLSSRNREDKPNYCPYCLGSLDPKKAKTLPLGASSVNLEDASIPFVSGHQPENDSIQFAIGPYQVIRSIGKGGMGEVFLAYDTLCGRRIALKKIRTDFVDHIQIHHRFLKEARITSQLTHPSIIPIYAIQGEGPVVYYTMPFVEGNTLKQIFHIARNQEKKGGKQDQIGSSIPSLIRIFLSVCQAIAYAHSKGVLHRDIKPENIIIGKYGEVLILDWGLAKLMKQNDDAEPEDSPSLAETNPLHEITHLGKIVGTLSYMAPERALRQKATVQTDIYSLGVILYQILTLRLPFYRKSLKEFRENIADEVLYDPIELSPYRDVPKMLSRMALRCLNPAPEERYKNIDELIGDLENYIEGRSEWFQIAELNINEKTDWEFQENVLIAEHIAITRGTEVSDWVSLMISKASFVENTKLETKVKIGDKGHGIGFLLSIPEAAERVHLNDGYCLWLGSDLNKSTKLLRSTLEVIHAPEVFLQRHEWYRIRIEKIDHNIHFYLNDMLQFSYISHLPLIGTHLGLLSRDADFTLTNITISVGSQNIKVNCLAVPDAFLAHKDYVTALNEYRRIGYSFPGTAEGREAMFRAGITLLEKARNCPDLVGRNQLYELSLDEFGKLHKTPGAPLEYLGKALVYQILQDYEEEIKCFEIAFRRYKHHPLLPVLREQIIYRMHESSRSHRKAAYSFALLAVEHLSRSTLNINIQKLFLNLQKHSETFPFFEEDPSLSSPKLRNISFGLQLAFCLAKPYILVEMIEKIGKISPSSSITIGNALFCLIELGAYETAEKQLGVLHQSIPKEERAVVEYALNLIKIAIQSHQLPLDSCLINFLQLAKKPFGKAEMRVLSHLLEQAIRTKQTSLAHSVIKQQLAENPQENALQLNLFLIESYLWDKNWMLAEEIFHQYSLELLNQESTPLHFFYGCWLNATEGKEISDIHFSGVLEVSFPRSWTLGSHFINGQIHEKSSWFQKAFLWEKRKLYHQMALYEHCIGNNEKSQAYQELELKEYV